jgi:hypothetical protein
MPLIRYESKKFRRSAQVMIHQANQILDEYLAQGFRGEPSNDES